MSDEKNGTALTVRQEQFGGMQTASVGETASIAIAAQAKAAIEARWIVAMRNRRDLDQVRAELLHECERQGFAEDATYRLEFGGKAIVGPTIRFVEAAIQSYGNCDTEVLAIYDDADKRIVEVRVTDFERNITHRKQVTITKVVERRSLRKGQTAISWRTNSAGDKTYLVEASDTDLLAKEGALSSKALRVCCLRLLPGWLVEEAQDRCAETVKRRDAEDPDAAKRRLADAFMTLGVKPADLATYFGHPLDSLVPAEIARMKQIYAALRDGQTTWLDVLESARGEQPATAAPETTPAAPAKGAESVKAAVKQRAKAAPKAPPAATTPTQRHPALQPDEAPIVGDPWDGDVDPNTGEIVPVGDEPDWMKS